MRWRTLKKKQHLSKPAAPKIEYAPFRSRALGFVTDIFMIGLPITLLVMVFFGYDQMDTATGLDVIMNDPKATANPPDPVASILQMVFFAAAFVWFWHTSGQTPGKKLAHIRVVDAKTFQNASYPKLILRFFLYPLGGIGFFVLFFRRDKRALHDLLSGTAVIREA